ncbi:3'(2'),5'-bisphosphate nucleotidase CysQ [Aquihabitans sp. McL0605]|uniref:3'(2'),5'-bisphosphate nucleotidase CysQ n=1 Tax=Aquihabitans sp. McL0605 TaxID=3415671 RepID=UPI003CE69419
MTDHHPSPADLAADHLLAAELAEGAGALLLEVRADLAAKGAPASELKATGDRVAHEYLMERLRALRPDDAILSEEGSGDTGRTGTERLAAERVWIVDPLDGTREYSEPPRSDWAVHVALVSGGQPIAGAVALPAKGLVLNRVPATVLPPAPPAKPRVIVSRSRPPAIALHLADALGAELVEMGSAGAKVAAVVLGEADVYPHSGGQYEWDSCAPVAVATAAGLVATRLDGSPLVYNNADPYLPDLLVCHPYLAIQARTVIDLWLSEQQG